ncbi:endonuclease domain-containing protein [Leucobacter sp. 1207-22]|uniref:endonuclease domain-containing protein n=1 Tax=Leucobacter sp. 1207-22 TaxID=2604456 RepID=UPI004063FF7B
MSVWDSALNKRLIGRGYLESLSLGKRAREVLAATSEFADSGLETFFRLRMQWLRVPLRSQTWLHGRRVDFLLGDRLVVQIDGGSHVGAQRDADNAHDAVLAASGYTVLRFGYAQVIHEWPAVQDAVMRAISARLHTRR